LAADRSADEQVIDRVLGGDREAFGLLVDAHGERLIGAIAAMTGDREVAADLSQEALVRAYTGLTAFRRGSAFYTWLYAIALNLVRSEYRRRAGPKGRPPASLDAPRGDGDDGGGFEPEAPGPGPAEDAERRDEARRVREALAEIDPEFRECVVLRDLEGLSYEEIGDALGVPAGTVRSRIHRGRAALRERLAGPEPRPDAGGGRS
jgi:RNA polymerase sigma-70 factor (ECF subfamily)